MSAFANNPKAALLNRFDSLDISLRCIEIDAEEEFRDHPMGRITFASILDVFETYVTVYNSSGELSENLQRKFHEVVTELFVIVTRAPEFEFDVDALKIKIEERVIGAPTLNIATFSIKNASKVYAEIAKNGLPDMSDPEYAAFFTNFMRHTVVVVLLSALTIEDVLVTINLDDSLV